MKANTNSITEKAMLVNLSISYWTGKASDDSVVDELTLSHETARDVHEYKKRLVKPEAINAFKAVRSKARAYHLWKTLPWIDGGTRILPAALYFEYVEAMRGFHAEYEAKVAEFVKNYLGLKNEAKTRLGKEGGTKTLYKESDYPSVEALRRKFGWDMHVFPIPSKEDWRVNVGDKAVAEIQAQVEAQVQAAVGLATRDLWQRLYDPVAKLAAKMADADSEFRDSIIENIRDIVALLPSMNIASDPKLEAMRKKIETELSKLNPAELREDEKSRKKAGDAADKILKAMAAYTGQL